MHAMRRTLPLTLCPAFHYAIELIGRRWTGAIVYLLLQSPARFSDLHDAIPGITDPMLTSRLRQLEREGVIERAVLPGSPVRVQYALTEKGRALAQVTRAIGDWSHDWVAPARPAAPRARRKPARTA
jgi:DNA-binding HxlR family transcriptional regulator